MGQDMQTAGIAAAGGVPPVSDLKTHNHLLGNREALDEAWARDGYWLFRDVLDQGALARLRRAYFAELERLGVADPVEDDRSTEAGIRYNGASLADFPVHFSPKAKGLAWRNFVDEAPIKAFFTELLGDEPFWVPVVEYRATPPAGSGAGNRLTGIHQDGPNSPGIPFRICWVPVAEIDYDVGGMILAEGCADEVNRHPILADGSNSFIRVEDIPPDRWRHSTLRAGDLLLVNKWTPRSGLSNVSDRFRLSFDHRVMAKSDKCPIVGEVVSIACDRIEIRDESGVTMLRIEPSTYVRGLSGHRVSGDEFYKPFESGSPVIAAHDNGLATVVRPPHSS